MDQNKQPTFRERDPTLPPHPAASRFQAARQAEVPQRGNRREWAAGWDQLEVALGELRVIEERVKDFEEQVRLRGGSTIYLGTDDENSRTSLGGVDLYPDPLALAAKIQNLARHPFEFYRKVGFTIVGLLPDANGFGKPDIFMAKRVRDEP